MSTDALLMLAFGVIAALGGLVLFFGEEPDSARLATVPVVKADHIQSGQHAKVLGVLKATQVLTTPYGEPCVYLRIVAYSAAQSREGLSDEVELWRHRAWSDDLSITDGYARVFLDLTHAEVRASATKVLTFSVLTDRDTLPGSLSRDLPPDTLSSMNKLVIESIPPNVTAVTAGHAANQGGLLTLGGTELVLSTESDDEREARKQRQQRWGVGLFVLAVLLITGALILPK